MIQEKSKLLIPRPVSFCISYLLSLSLPHLYQSPHSVCSDFFLSHFLVPLFIPSFIFFLWVWVCEFLCVFLSDWCCFYDLCWNFVYLFFFVCRLVLFFLLFLSFFIPSVFCGLWSLAPPAMGQAWISETEDPSPRRWATRELPTPWNTNQWNSPKGLHHDTKIWPHPKTSKLQHQIPHTKQLAK